MDAAGTFAAGYLGVYSHRRPAGMDVRYVRDPLLSVSRCLVDLAPAVSWGSRAYEEDLASVGVDRRDLAEARAWADQKEREGRLVYPALCRSPADVAEFIERFTPAAVRRPAIVGIGLPAGARSGFLASPGVADGPRQGVAVLLEEQERLVPGFEPLGYEPLVSEYDALGCSWTCNGLQAAVAGALGIEPNGEGFLATAEEARAVVEYLASPAVATEPGVWWPWLVVRYGQRSA